jgi:hypothetical protein
MTKQDYENYFLAEAKDCFNEMNLGAELGFQIGYINFWERKMYYALFQWAGFRE